MWSDRPRPPERLHLVEEGNQLRDHLLGRTQPRPGDESFNRGTILPKPASCHRAAARCEPPPHRSVRWEYIFGHDLLAEHIRHAVRGRVAEVHHETGAAVFLPLNVADMDVVCLDPAKAEKGRRTARVG